MSCNCIKPKCGNGELVPFWCGNDGRDVEFIPLTEFLPRVTLIAKGVPEEVAIEYLREACQIVAKNSLLCKRELRLDVQAYVRDYYLENGNLEQVHYVDEIAYSGKGSVPLSLCNPCRQAVENSKFIFEPNDKIILKETPKVDGENKLYVRYFAIPTQNACEVDQLLFDRYHDVAVNGALSRLLLMRPYRFADPQMALFYDTKFKQGIAHAKIDVTRKFKAGRQSIAYQGRL